MTGPLDLGAIKGTVELDISNFERKYGDIDRMLSQLASRQVRDVQLGADTTKADAAFTKVEQAAKRVDGTTATPTVTADTSKADADLSATQAFLTGVLDGMQAEVAVTGDTSKADAAIGGVEKLLASLSGDVATVKVDADTSPAETAIRDLGDEGEAAGDDAGSGMSKGIIAGLAAIPVVGGILLIGKAIADGLLDGIMDGLQQEATRDMFSARTGLDDATAAKFGRAAGDAYGSAWGNSVEENLDTARLALQGGLIDGDATAAEVEKVIASLTGVSELLGEDIPRLSRAAGVMIKTGMAKDLDDALDILTAGMQSGANVSEDLLDTFTEYPAVFSRLGIDGATSMGLISQAMEAGARDTDYAADALKEFQIRATDGNPLAVESFDRLGLSGKDMLEQIAAGGEGARAGLDMALDKLREMEPGVERTQIAVGLFGTKAEDLGDALFAMDASTAVKELEDLGDVAGRAEAALETMSDNGASAVEGAKRSIEVAGDGIKGALATAFQEPLSDLATFVSTNRSGVLEYLGGIATGMFDMGRAGVEGAAVTVEAMGKIPAALTPVLDSMIQTLGVIQAVSQLVPGIPDLDLSGSIGSLFDMKTEITGIGTSSKDVADEMRTSLIENGIDPIEARFNEGLDTQILAAGVHDATTRMASDIGAVGESMVDISKIKLFEDGSFKVTNDDARALSETLLTAVGSITDVQTAAKAAGEGQEALTEKWRVGRDALVDTLVAMGFTTQEAKDLAEAYGAVPEQIETSATLDDALAITTLNGMVAKIDDATGEITIDGDKTPADTTLGDLIGKVDKSDGTVKINGNKVPATLTLEEYLGEVGRSFATSAILGDSRKANTKLDDYVARVNRSEGTSDILGDAKKGNTELDRYVARINREDGTVDVKANTSKASETMRQWFKDQSGKTVGVTYGFNSGGGRENGGIQVNGRQTFADGGMTDGGVPVARQSMMGGPQYGQKNILWGEDVTGWEAYISGKPGQEARNLDILGIAANKMGKRVVERDGEEYANGGIRQLEAYANGGTRNMPTTLDVNATMGASVAEALKGLGGGMGGSAYSGATGDWQKIVAMLRGAGFDPRITSTYRGGARTATGYQSRHSLGKAVDMGNDRAMWDWLEARKGMFRELYGPYGRGWNRGQSRYDKPGGGLVQAIHRDHIHAAFEDGGLSGLGGNSIMDAMASPKMADTGAVTLDEGANVVYNGLGRKEHLQETPRTNTQTGPITIYVQSPITGEHFLADFRTVADEQIDGDREFQDSYAMKRGNRR